MFKQKRPVRIGNEIAVWLLYVVYSISLGDKLILQKRFYKGRKPFTCRVLYQLSAQRETSTVLYHGKPLPQGVFYLYTKRLYTIKRIQYTKRAMKTISLNHKFEWYNQPLIIQRSLNIFLIF